MTSPSENPRPSDNLIIKALTDPAIQNELGFKITPNPSNDKNWEWEDIEAELDELLDYQEVLDLFLSIPDHKSLGPEYRRNSREYFNYLGDFITAVVKLIKSAPDAGDIEAVKEALGIEPETVNKSKSIVEDTAFDIRAAISSLIGADGAINLGDIKDPKNGIFGQQELLQLPGNDLLAKVRGVVGDSVEVVIDDHTLAQLAIRNLVDQNEAIPEAQISFMKSYIQGGDSIADLPDWKVAQQYLIQSKFLGYEKFLPYFKGIEENELGVKTVFISNLTPKKAILSIQESLDTAKKSHKKVLSPACFDEELKNYLQKHYPNAANFEARLRAFLRSNDLEHILDEYEFKRLDAWSEVSIETLNTACNEIMTAVEINEKQEKVFRPGLMSELVKSVLIRRNKNGFRKGSFKRAVQGVFDVVNRSDEISDITVLSREEETKLLTAQKHLLELKTVLDNQTNIDWSSFSTSFVSYIDKHYNHLKSKKRVDNLRLKLNAFLEELGEEQVKDKLNSKFDL